MASRLFFVLEDHPEVAQNNCKFLKMLDSDAICIPIEHPDTVLKRLKLESPDLIVVDLQFGRRDGTESAQPGLDFLKVILEKYSTLNVLIYTSQYSWLQRLGEAIQYHEGGFVVVSKLQRRKAFLEGAEGALNQEFRVPRELQQYLQLTLTERDVQILHLVCQESLTDRAIAQRLHVSLKTAQNYIQRLKIKLGVDLADSDTSSRVGLCMEAIRRKLLSF